MSHLTDRDHKSLFKTPYEAMLEHQVSDLKRKLAALSSSQFDHPAVTAFPANEIAIGRVAPTLMLAIEGGYKATDGEAYHVWAREHPTVGNFGLGYYISDRQILSNSDCARVMQSCLEKATMQLIEVVRA